jgi:O-acetyl-ADP-ribose deacetylase (regulator of RNase III)
MIEVKQGNLLEAEADALVNTVNCVGVMGKGIALQFKKAFPDNFKAYKKACDAGQVQPGKMFVSDAGNLMKTRYIINFPTKRHWRGKSRMEDVESGLEALVADIQRLKIKSIALPPLGCGNGGLDWNAVRPRIEQAFTGLPDVEVQLFEPAGTPQTKKMVNRTEKPHLTVARALFIKLLDLYKVANYELSRLEIQKLAYFLQGAGEPLKLNYEAGKYGPYAHNLNHVLDRLDGHYINGYGDNTGKADDASISLLDGAVKEADQFLTESHSLESEQRLSKVQHLIEGFETPYGMELLATVHWVTLNVDNPPASEDEAVSLVQAWSQRKAELFTPRHVRIAYKRLQENGWLKSCNPKL